MFGFISVAAVAGPFEATPADTDLKALVERWANVEHKRLIWEADGNAKIMDSIHLNAVTKLSRASNFEEAVDRLNQRLALEEKRMLQVCVYENAIVVRTMAQPECSKPL